MSNKIILTAHTIPNPEHENQSIAKKRISYEDIFKERQTKLDTLNLSELQKEREKLIDWRDSIDLMLREDGIKESRRQYLIGLRNHVCNPLLNHAKKRKTTLNRVIHNGVSRDFANRFVEIAMKELDLATFQSIYGKAITIREIENQTIEDIKQFMNDSLCHG